MATLIPVTSIALNPDIRKNALTVNTEVEIPASILPTGASKKDIQWSATIGSATFREATVSGAKKYYMTPTTTGDLNVIAVIKGGKLLSE